MEQETGATAKGKDSDDKRNAPDSSSTTEKKADQDQQILMDTADTNWFKNTQALKYLQFVFVPVVKDNMKSLQLQTMTDFGRQLCAEATADDIIQASGRLAQFKHVCPGMVVACQCLLNIIKGHTKDSVNFYQMLKGTDPQNWLKSPFEFVRLFLKDRMRCDIHDFQECDITALCTIVKRCKPLMQIFEERKIDELRKVRNRTMHPATMRISEQEMEDSIDVILDFLEHIKSLQSTNEVTEAIENVKQLRTGDVRLLHYMVVRLIQEWLPGARIAYEHKSDQAKNLLTDIIYMENKLATLSSGHETTPMIKQSKEHEVVAKLTDENQKLKQVNEDLVKRNEELRKLLEISNPKLPRASPATELSDRTISDPGHSPAIKCTDVSKIPIKTVKDTRRYYITGMVAISGTQLILADANNECIKLLDLERWAVIGVKELPSAPHDVTCVPGSRVAVTIPYSQQIHFFTADQNLKQCGVVRVDGICFGLHCSGDRLYVACKDPPVVQILNMDGDIIKTIKIDPIVYPKYLTCSPDNKFIYVSDIHNDTVTCMDMAGSVQWVYNDENYKTENQMTPQGVCTGDECIYICSSHEIRVVSPTGANLAVIPFSQTGAMNGAVCYSSQERTLYESTFSSDPEQTKYISRIRMR